MPDAEHLVVIEQLQRNIVAAREIIENKLEGFKAAVETRFAAMDKAIVLLQNFADRTPTTLDVQHEVEQLREVTMKMFDSVAIQFSDRDARFERAAREVRLGVDTAFAAAKESVNEHYKSNAAAIVKSEVIFTKQIDNITDMIRANAKAVDDKISDIKERVTIIESRSSVTDPAVVDALRSLGSSMAPLTARMNQGVGSERSWVFAFGVVGMILGLLTIGSILAVAFRVMR